MPSIPESLKRDLYFLQSDQYISSVYNFYLEN